MPRALSQLRDTVLVACLAALSCLPPSGLQLCVGADGHWALEPTAIAGDACCESSPAGPESGASEADDCPDCTDYVLSGGAAVGSRWLDVGPDGAADAPCVTPGAANVSAPPRVPCPVAGGATRPPHAAPSLRSTILRC